MPFLVLGLAELSNSNHLLLMGHRPDEAIFTTRFSCFYCHVCTAMHSLGIKNMALGSGQNYQPRFVALQPLCVGPITSPCRRFYFVVASCFRFVVSISSWRRVFVSSFLFRRGVAFSLRRVFVSSWRRVFVSSFLFRRGVVFSFRHVFVSSWGLVWFRRGVALDKSGLRF